MKTFAHVDALPTWFITNAITPFLPKSHPWKGRSFGLVEWSEGRKPLCMMFDFVFWLGAFILFASRLL